MDEYGNTEFQRFMAGLSGIDGFFYLFNSLFPKRSKSLITKKKTELEIKKEQEYQEYINKKLPLIKEFCYNNNISFTKTLTLKNTQDEIRIILPKSIRFNNNREIKDFTYRVPTIESLYMAVISIGANIESGIIKN